MLNQAAGPIVALGMSVALHLALFWHPSSHRLSAYAYSPPQGKAGMKVAIRIAQQKKSTKVEKDPTPPVPNPEAPEFEKPTPQAVRRVDAPTPPEARLETPAVTARRNTHSNWVADVAEVRREPVASAPPPRPKPVTPPEDRPKPPDAVRPQVEAVLADAEVVAQLDDVMAMQAVKATGVETTHPPQSTYSPRPEYPPQALAERREGDVQVRFLIDSAGVVRDVRLERSSGFADFDAEAQAAIARYRFAPSRRGGFAIASEHTLTFMFRMPRP